MADSERGASDRLLSDSTGVPAGGTTGKPPGVYNPPPIFYPPQSRRSSTTGGFYSVCSRYSGLLCVGIAVFAGLCHVAGFSTEGWAYHDVYIYKMKFGLWRYTQCWDYSFLGGAMTCFDDYMLESATGDWKMDMKNIGNYRVYITGWIKASQALESLALIGYVITCGLIIGHVFSSEARENRNVEIAFVISSCITMLLAIVGAITYAVNMMERCWYSSAECTMGYSFGLVVAGCILSIIAATLKVLEMVGMFKDYSRSTNYNYNGNYDAAAYKPGY